MERSSNLAPLSLVSKYYPVANYSYPRNDIIAPYSATSSLGKSNDRTSLGSQGSAPGLVDDRTDSEVSVDDDYQYHTHTAELWDSFWQPGERGEMMEEPPMHPRKQYPALITSPRKRRQTVLNDEWTAWPLLDGSSRERNRKPAATYAASPKPKSTMPPPRTTSMIPARTSRSGPGPTPCRPPRPSDELLTLCIQQPVVVPAILATPDHLPPLTPTMDWRPSSPFIQRASKSPGKGSTRPLTANADVYAAALRSSNHLPLSCPQTPTSRAPRRYKSIAHLAPPPPQSHPEPEPEPHSVFEYDDTESEGEHGRSFFRFHKRSDSDDRSSKPAAPEPNTQIRHHHKHALTSPVRLRPDRPCKQETLGRKRQGHDVFGRMLGRRSR
ncbi:Uncharacterized protein TCAP_02888 [Tolypocladium capitatum]|uniref:Uncharacterized protein n=1 Tax=Tolypocladium capitatum TaxID=45235 RepID=A0A2K3QI49_9HYPO|nr:Uncharacterized protein TCAP_02888 [Tolypocladium capitatum]